MRRSAIRIAITGTLTSGGTPVAGKFVTITVGGTTQIGVTDSAGRVTVEVPAVAVTGAFRITASFGGDEGTQQSSTSAPLVVSKAPSSLVALPPVGATLSGVLNGVVQPLQQESVAFAVNGPGGARTIFAITDYLGRATLPPPGLPAGDYSVTQTSFAGNTMFAATSATLQQQFSVPKTAQAITFAATRGQDTRRRRFPGFRVGELVVDGDVHGGRCVHRCRHDRPPYEHR